MRRNYLLGLLVIGAGCAAPEPVVYVDISAIPERTFLAPQVPRVSGLALAQLPPQSGTLPGLEGTHISLAETGERVREARQLIQANRQAALRSLTNALYRAYSREAAATRAARSVQIEKDAETMANAAYDEIYARLTESARQRWPLANRLALLVGFPISNPENRPRPQNKFDARRHDEAVAAWKALLAEDAAFAAEAARILAALEAEIATLRTQVQIDFTRALNQASDRATREAESAVASRAPELSGRLMGTSDVRIPASPAKKVSVGEAPPPKLPDLPAATPMNLQNRFLEHDLSIWLNQNGYRRSLRKTPGVPDRTKEFMAWLEKRRGL